MTTRRKSMLLVATLSFLVAGAIGSGAALRTAAAEGDVDLSVFYTSLAPYGEWVQLQLANEDFRRVLYTGKHLQLVLMCLAPGEEIGTEAHRHVDQFFRVEEGTAVFVLNGRRHEVRDGGAAVVPAGARHKVVNASKRMPRRLYTLYAPPNHAPGTVERTRADEAVEGART